MNLKIDDDFRNLLPALSSDEYTGLEKDIVKRGILNQIIVWNETIIDGHNRYEIAKAHHIQTIPTKEISFKTKAEAMRWIIEHQVNRRNLSKSQLVNAYSMYEAEVAKEDEANLHLSKGQGVKGSSNLNEVKTEPIRTAAEVAKKMGVSENTYRDMKLVMREGTPEQIERMDKGGEGNGVSTIAREVRDKDIPETKKRCRKCKRILPLSEFNKNPSAKDGYRSSCRDCDASYKVAWKKQTLVDVKGDVIKSTGEFDNVSDEKIVGDLYNTEKEISVSVADVVEEFTANLESSISNLRRILETHKEIVIKNKEVIKKMWNDAETSFEKLKGEYV